MRSMRADGTMVGPLPTAVSAARMASAWGQGTQMQHHLADAYNLGFTARAGGAQLSESDWAGIRAGRPSLSRGYISPTSPYLAPWSPALSGSGIRGVDGGPVLDLDAIADAVVAETFGVMFLDDVE